MHTTYLGNVMDEKEIKFFRHHGKESSIFHKEEKNQDSDSLALIFSLLGDTYVTDI
jgi:hypothetical protein